MQHAQHTLLRLDMYRRGERIDARCVVLCHRALSCPHTCACLYSYQLTYNGDILNRAAELLCATRWTGVFGYPRMYINLLAVATFSTNFTVAVIPVNIFGRYERGSPRSSRVRCLGKNVGWGGGIIFPSPIYCTARRPLRPRKHARWACFKSICQLSH